MENTPKKTDKEKIEKNENDIKQFITECENLSVDKKIKIIGKILHYCQKKIVYFIVFVYKNTDINPFLIDIKFGIELIPDKVPYVRVMSDFTLPALYDNRNIYYCLTNRHEYRYNLRDLNKLNFILKDLVSYGISNFLYCIKENIQIKAFVFYGEYELGWTYNINDFLENDKILKFYRINQVLKNGDFEERYLILTQLYFLEFKPNEKDKTFATLILIKILKDIKFTYKESFNNKLNRKTLLLNLENINNKKLNSSIELSLIDKNDIENKKTEEIIIDEYYLFQEEIEKKQKEIDFEKFCIIIKNYKPLFNHRSDNLSSKDISEYDKLIEYNEKLFKYYLEKKNDNQAKKRLEFFLVNINFFCSELMGIDDAKDKDTSIYLKKMKDYLIMNENF